MVMEKEILGSRTGSVVPPPPYEVPAYSRGRFRRRRLLVRSVVPIWTVLSFVIAVSVLWLCLTLNRQFTQWRSPPWSEHQQAQQPETATMQRLLQLFEESLVQCEGLNSLPVKLDVASRKANPRWTPTNGQEKTTVLRNTTLFDGEAYLPHAMDIVFARGLIQSIRKTTDNAYLGDGDVTVYDVHGRHVTPGLVDMHSHHLALMWPANEVTDDGNEMTQDTKALTPMMRVIDGLKAYDVATRHILSGGVTSSLLIPGSANLIGGEGVPVKNVLYSGQHSEPVVEDMLLERGVPASERRRYMKMALGENPKATWGYTRMGNAWHLRAHLQKAKELKEKQDDYCEAMSGAHSWDATRKVTFTHRHGRFPFQLELESTVAVLRGRVLVQNHNYEPEDMETMLRIGREFGYRVQAFHHATEAWQVPHMLKEQGENITVAIFAEFSLYKQEAYSPSLHAGHILNKNGIPVAYKSDHSVGFTNAKYLASQAAIGHAFHLPEDKALQSITSIPAKAIDLDFRVGYCRPGYDADIVVWDSHPLSNGATPLQVFVDGLPQLNQSQVEESMAATFTAAGADGAASPVQPQVRLEREDGEREEICSSAFEPGQNLIIDGIQKAFVENYPKLQASLKQQHDEPLTMIVEKGGISCLGSALTCSEATRALETSGKKIVRVSLRNGHVLPGLTAVTRALGTVEIATLDSTGDGQAKDQKIQDPESLAYAKYGIWLDGKGFARARLGGVTRAITPPLADEAGFVQGVSVEIVTSGRKSLTDGGIVQEEVALHLSLGESTKLSEGTVSGGVHHLRNMLQDGKGKHNATLYGRVAAGVFPLVVHCNNKYDLAQLVLIKKDFPETNLVIMGGKEAPYVAKSLAAANISMILTESRPAPDTFRDKDAVIGPPLSRSVASYLREAGVKFAVGLFEIGMPMDYRLHALGPEAGWVAKYANLNEEDTVRLVTSNMESILGLKKSKDIVVYEGNPLQFGATVALSFHADDETGVLEVATCFPQEEAHSISLDSRP